MISKREIGSRIKKVRNDRELKQKQLAKILKTRSEQISRIETGNANYGIDWLFKIAGALKCGVEEFFYPQDGRPHQEDFIRFMEDWIKSNKS